MNPQVHNPSSLTGLRCFSHLLGGWCHEASPAKCWKSVGLPTRQSAVRNLVRSLAFNKLSGSNTIPGPCESQLRSKKSPIFTKNGGKLICKKNYSSILYDQKWWSFLPITNISSGAACFYLKWSWLITTRSPFLMHHELKHGCSLIYAFSKRRNTDLARRKHYSDCLVYIVVACIADTNISCCTKYNAKAFANLRSLAKKSYLWVSCIKIPKLKRSHPKVGFGTTWDLLFLPYWKIHASHDIWRSMLFNILAGRCLKFGPPKAKGQKHRSIVLHQGMIVLTPTVGVS